MTNFFNDNSVITHYLTLYPKSQWKQCQQLTLVIGINSLQSSFSGFLSLDQLKIISQSSVPPIASDIQARLSQMKSELDRINKTIEPEQMRRALTGRILNNQIEKKPLKTGSRANLMEEQTTERQAVKIHKNISNVQSVSQPRGSNKRKIYHDHKASRNKRRLLKNERKASELPPRLATGVSHASIGDQGVIRIADGFLNNPLISLLSHSQKAGNKERCRKFIGQFTERNSDLKA